MNAITGLTPERLRKAADIQEQISFLTKELTAVLAGNAPAVRTTAKRARNMSAAGRAAISAAAKARWQKFRYTAGTPKGPSKRRLSAAAKARLSAIAKARWQKVKNAGKSRL